MDSTSIDLASSTISSFEIEGTTVKIFFEPAIILKTMTGSVEQTRWWQNGELVFDGVISNNLSEFTNLPAPCEGGDIGENIYTYRDMIPVPLESVGRAHCNLKIAGSPTPIEVQAEAVTLVLKDVAKYIEHLRPD
tara:strand:+ start:22794 stop:23198 length:405 start_codon:yes stop_codon:yes gene_type:complete